MNRSDLASGAVFAALGAATCIYAFGLNRSGTMLGAGTFPFAVGVVLALAGIGVAAGGVFGAAPETSGRVKQPPDPRRLAAIGIIPVAILAYVWLLVPVGAVLLNFGVVAVVSWVWGQRWWSALLLGAVTSVVVYELFTSVLGVVLPRGVLGW